MTPRSVLLVRLSSLGDIACALPLAAALAQRGLRVGQVVEAPFAPLLEHVRFPLEAHVWQRGLRGRWALRGAGAGYDVVLDLQGNTKSGFVASGLGAERIVGPAAEDVRERGNLLFTTERAAAARHPHVLARSLAVVNHVLERPLELDALPRPPLLEARESSVRRLEAQVPADFDTALVLGPAGDARCVPLVLLEELAAELGPRALLVAGPRERHVHVRAGLPMLRQAGALAELLALGTLLRRRGGVALGPDGGAMHVLRACGVSTHFVFGPQDPQRTGPFGEAVTIAAGELACRPCVRRVCLHPHGPVCMTRLTLDTLRTLLRDSPRGAR